ncbi:hypothetical protein VCHA56P521_10164 [Vibrio chagasii]|nr:hypothetical protein VCHA34P131_10087 [Vibrio chagasii]CAH6833863.1 hypothetical protein VCHA32P90_10178 [Vibrio chagasii]CAH6838357.1 hypothetical protein VCHA34P116_10178 [Vibrio chagasii]CAH6863230.1 hypothetical protein VCHA35O137_10951 [Vibrio chagasii]CAH6894374.1 hypothetical protein VCHA36P168_20476 [Vibrio chagasii]
MILTKSLCAAKLVNSQPKLNLTKNNDFMKILIIENIYFFMVTLEI